MNSGSLDSRAIRREDSAASIDAALNVLLHGLLPIVLFATVFLWIAWRWGRLYCGWLCPFGALQELARENEVPLIVAPAAANDITGVNFNEYTFRTSRNNYQDSVNMGDG